LEEAMPTDHTDRIAARMGAEFVTGPTTEPVAVTQEELLHFIFDGPSGPECGRFIECETPDGRSVNAGTWHERGDGYWELRVHRLTHSPAAEREACAKVADGFAEISKGERFHIARSIAAAIRARPAVPDEGADQ
jgi:hypothetical protein